MGFLKRLAFYIGLMLGLTTIAAAGTVAFTYLFTGKLVSVELAGEKPEVTLMTPDEVVVLIRDQVNRIKAAGAEGGDQDVSEPMMVGSQHSALCTTSLPSPIIFLSASSSA